jgi:sortase (surface protein transpeptidase)
MSSSPRWSALGLTLVVAAAVLAVRGGDVEAPTAGVQDATSASSPSEGTRGVSSATPPPRHLRIPSIGVSTELVRLGLQKDRTVEVPQDATLAGWFDHGPVPGERGSSVILGHVDSAEGPAVFHALSDLRSGDPIHVERSDGSVARFEVRRVSTYANEDFPAQEVYAGSKDQPALNLVTCGGEYDPARGGWQSNVVVYGVFVGTTAASA